MKKLFFTLLTFLILISSAYADLKPYPYPFIGRWQPSESPVLIDGNGFQDIRNVRKDGKRLRGVGGHTLLTDNIVNATYYKIRNGFHFKKDQPAESNILVYATNAAGTASRVYKNISVIPAVLDFTATELHTNATDSLIGRFSNVPQGNVLYCNGLESQIWGGAELKCNAVYFSDDVPSDTISNARNYSKQLSNTSDDSDQIAAINATYNRIIIGSPRPLQGIKIYVETVNDTASTLTGKVWTGSWTALSITDNTSVGGISLAKTGIVAFTSTETTATKKLLEGSIYYWYYFELSAGTAKIYYITLDAPCQKVRNIWDGVLIDVGELKKYDGTTYKTYSDEVKDSTITYTAVFDSFDTTHASYLGFTEPMQGFDMKVLAEKENSIASVLTVKYWDGDSWVAVSDLVNGTSEGGVTLAKSGVINFTPVVAGLEFETSIADELPLYYYQFTVSVQLDGEVEIYNIKGIPASGEIPGYVFPGHFQNRAWLFSEYNGVKNRAIYSAYNSPDIWNGSDSGYLNFGDNTALTASCNIFNVFRTTGYDQLIVTKANETYRVLGTGPDDWENKQMSGNIGCIAPLSMVVCDVAILPDGLKQQIAMWQSSKGFVRCDGATIDIVSFHDDSYSDIRCYFDPNDSRYIPVDRQDDTVGSYDSNLQSCKFLISSGAGQTTHNVELEYSLITKEWTSIYRENSDGANPYQCIFQVADTVGNKYTYGCTDEGYMYRAENGTTWNGIDIEQYVHTKDMLLDDEQPFFRHTTINYIRLMFEKKDGAVISYLEIDDGDYLLTETGDRIILFYSENISFIHYGDQVLTVDGEDDQKVPESISFSDGPFETQDCLLGPSLLHSFKIYGSFSTLTDGMELMGLGLYYEPTYTIEQ